MKRGLLTMILTMVIGMTVLAAPRSGWSQKSDGTWQYWKADGTKAAGWVEVDDEWYYMDEDGNMQTGWVKPYSFTWYYLAEDGHRVNGQWVETDGKWYYLKDIFGDMLTNTMTPDGYYVNAYGEWSPMLSETRIFPYMSEKEEQLFNMVNELFEQRMGKKLQWDATAHKAARLAVTRWVEHSLVGDFEKSLRDAGYEGYEVRWVSYGSGTSERFVELIDERRNEIFMPNFNYLGVAIEEQYYVDWDTYIPSYVIYIME